MGGFDRLTYSSRKLNMIVLQHDHIVKSEPMVLSATQANRPFFQHSEIWSGFSGIEQFCLSMAYQLVEVKSFGGYPAHPLHAVQNQSFRSQDGTGPPFNRKTDISFIHLLSVFQIKFDAQFWIEIFKNHSG